jgi:hypothetical protein
MYWVLHILPTIPPEPSLYFNGPENYVVMSPGVSFGTTTTPFTIECWFYTTYDPSTLAITILGAGGPGLNGGAPFLSNALTLYSIGSNNSFRMDSQGRASQEFIFPTTFVPNTWYYLAVTRDSSANNQMWIGTKTNGYAVASITGPLSLTNSTNWDLTGISYLLGFWTAGPMPYNYGTYLHNLRITNDNRFATNAGIIPIPTTDLPRTIGTQLLVNGSLIDQTGNQQLTTVGSIPSVVTSPFA